MAPETYSVKECLALAYNLSFAFKKMKLLPAPPLGNTGFDLTLGSKMSVISFFLTLSLPATCLLRLKIKNKTISNEYVKLRSFK